MSPKPKPKQRSHMVDLSPEEAECLVGLLDYLHQTLGDVQLGACCRWLIRPLRRKLVRVTNPEPEKEPKR